MQKDSESYMWCPKSAKYEINYGRYLFNHMPCRGCGTQIKERVIHRSSRCNWAMFHTNSMIASQLFILTSFAALLSA